MIPERTYDEQLDCHGGNTILIVDDEEDGRLRLQSICNSLMSDEPVQVFAVSTIEDAIARIAQHTIHLVLLDKNLKLPNGSEENGIEAIPDFLHHQPHLQILMVSGSKQVDDVVEAMRLGAFGYVTKDSGDDLIATQIRKALSIARLSIQKTCLERSSVVAEPPGIMGHSRAARQLTAQVMAVSETDRPVLLLGESGTGKTTIARVIHNYRRKYLKQGDRPFFEVHLGAMASTLVERELFGNEAGAFTGAAKMKQGLIELANNGTLFLDEIGEISPELQVKLLKVLEGGTFFRVGGTKPIRSSFKLICATNRNIEEMVANGTFREDLYWRISTFKLLVPSLEERREDIPEIIRTLLPRCSKESHVQVAYEELPEEFIEHIRNNPPPGNMRGIEQQLHHLLVYSPKDRNGHPVLKKWRSVISYQSAARSKRVRDQLTINDLMNMPVSLDTDSFPGLPHLISAVEEKVLAAAKARFSKNVEIARFLKVSEGNISIRLRRLKEKESGVTRLGGDEGRSEVLQ